MFVVSEELSSAQSVQDLCDKEKSAVNDIEVEKLQGASSDVQSQRSIIARTFEGQFMNTVRLY